MFGRTSVPGAILGGPGPGPVGPGPAGPGFGPGDNNRRFAYRLDATAHTGRIGLNYAFTRKMSLDFSARYRNTRARGDNQYQSFALDGAFSYRF